jgi:hypothetical protein
MRDARKDTLGLDLDRRLKLEVHATKVTSDAGLPACRELDDALRLTSAIDSEPFFVTEVEKRQDTGSSANWRVFWPF